MYKCKRNGAKKLSFWSNSPAYLLLQFLVLYTGNIFAQTAPPNDNFKNASEIIIPNGGYDLGTFQSAKADLTKATKEAGESIHLLQYFAGTDKKTVWYVFETETARNITVELRQKDTLISQDGVGITIYKTRNKFRPPNLGEVDNNLTPLSKFGSSGNTCLSPDVYYVQVSAKANANAEIWLNLVVDNASPSHFDQPKDACNFGKLQNSNNITFEVGCLGINSKSEMIPALGSEYNQSAWITFTTDNYSDIIAFSFGLSSKVTGPDTVKVGYRLYKGDAKNAFSKLRLVDSAVFSKYCNANSWNCGQLGMRQFMCGMQPDTVYYMQLLFHKKAQFNFSVQSEEGGDKLSLSHDPKNLPAAYRAGILKQSQIYNFKDNFACNSLMADNLCGKVNPPLLIDTTFYSPDYKLVDTFDMSLWMTFEVTKSGIVDIQNNSFFCGSNYNKFGYRLYKGDVTQDCNLPVLWKRASYGGYVTVCIEPGVYSVQVLGRKNKKLVSNLCYELDLGKEVNLAVRFYERTPETPSKFYNPSAPEDLGDITASLSSGVQSQTDYFGMADDTVTIDGDKFFNRFHYRQFYLSRPTYLTIETQHPNGFRMLYKGKVSEGVNKLKKLPDSIYGSPYISYHSPYLSLCTPLPAGWYTVVSVIQVACYNLQGPQFDFLTFRSITLCDKKFNRPYKASYYGQVDWNTSASNPGETSKTFYLAQECFNCSTDTPFSSHPLVNCTNINSQSNLQAAYYVFDLKQESYVRISALFNANFGGYGNGLIQLFKGDVRKDSLKFKDTTYLLAPCNGRNEFCRLQPGTYTLVITGRASALVTPAVTVDKITSARYDHARNAADLGIIPPNNTEKISPIDAFYCTTGAYHTDPDTNSNYFYYYYNKKKSSVPYPMPQNYEISNNYYERKNLWYTFVCAGTGDVTVTVYPKSTHFNRTYFAIYSSDEKYFGPYANLVAAGKADSTDKQGLQLIARSTYEHSAVFTKKGCDSVRYYVIVERPVENSVTEGNHSMKVGVKYNNVISNGTKADNCKNAAKLTLSQPGETGATALVNCHTRGESFGEDGSNMACLVRDTMPYKTTWYKFTYTGSQRADISFRIEENTTALPSQIHYRVLYGNCDAMTPGPCVENAFSYFTLDCMGKGDYYIQVVSPESATGEITLFAKASPTTYPICKPIDLLTPLSNFSFTGGCNKTPVQFINLSSAGNDISYAWNFGNGTTSTEKSPAVLFKPTQLIDTFQVSLRVTNNQSKKYDEITIPVIIFRDSIELNLAGKHITIGCNDKPKLEASSNYPFATYEWKPKDGLDNAHSANPVFTHSNTDATYIVTMRAESCILTDTVHIYLRPEILISGDTLLCHGGKGYLTATGNYDYYYWSNGKNTHVAEINYPGVYWVQGYNQNGCRAIDTFIVKDGSQGIVKLPEDITICPEDSVVLKPVKAGTNPLWSTGETTNQITVNKAGKYWLRMDGENCSGYDTIEVFHKPVPFVDLKDTVYLCGGKAVWIDITKPGQEYVWSHGSNYGKVLLNKPGKYFVQIKENGCVATDSVVAEAAELPVVNLKDTALCGDFSFNIDAGDWKAYNWQPGNSSERELTVNTFGRYIVKVTDNKGCENSDTVNIIQHCEPHIWVPNAFTPNNEEPNNIFKPVLHDIYTMEMKIYNRWGELIFVSTDKNKGWDGSFNGKACTPDLYLWTITYTALYTNEYIYGTVTLLK